MQEVSTGGLSCDVKSFNTSNKKMLAHCCESFMS